MGKFYLDYYISSKIYTCKSCSSHLSSASELISKEFWAGDGKAFLYNSALNYFTGPSDERLFRTGLHRVRDVFCKYCKSKVGWKYEWAREHSQKYKEGKIILERNLIAKSEWLD